VKKRRVILALLISAAGASADADAANLAFVQCLFAQSRSAHTARLSPEQFEAALAGRCQAEERVLAGAAPNVGATAQEARQMVVEDYRRTVELEPELKRLGELCRSHPDQCRY